MPIKHDFSPSPLPIFIAEPQQNVEKLSSRAVDSRRLLKGGILVGTATAIGIATLFLENPPLFANVTAFLVGNPLLQRSPDEGALTVRSEAGVQASSPSPEEAPTRSQIADSESSGERQMESSEPASEALVRQFQAWVAGQDVLAAVPPVGSFSPPPVVENVRAESVPAQNREAGRAPLPRIQTQPSLRPVQSGHAEIRPVQHQRKTVRREQNARVQGKPEQNPRTLRPPVQNAQPLSLLQTVGQRN